MYARNLKDIFFHVITFNSPRCEEKMVDNCVLNGFILDESTLPTVEDYDMISEIETPTHLQFSPDFYTAELIASSVLPFDVNDLIPEIKLRGPHYSYALLKGSVRFSNKSLFLFLTKNTFRSRCLIVSIVNTCLPIAFDAYMNLIGGGCDETRIRNAKFIFHALLKEPRVSTDGIRDTLERIITHPSEKGEPYFGLIQKHPLFTNDIITSAADRIVNRIYESGNYLLVGRIGKWRLNSIVRKLTSQLFSYMDRHTIDNAKPVMLRFWVVAVSVLCKYYTLEDAFAMELLDRPLEKNTANLLFVKSARYSNHGIFKHVVDMYISIHNTPSELETLYFIAMKVCISTTDSFYAIETDNILKYLISKSPSLVDAFITASYISSDRAFKLLFFDTALTENGVFKLIKLVVRETYLTAKSAKVLMMCLGRMALDPKKIERIANAIGDATMTRITNLCKIPRSTSFKDNFTTFFRNKKPYVDVWK